MKKLKYLLLFLFIIFIIPNVFAQDFTVQNTDITSPSGQGRIGTYSGLEIYNGGSPAVYNIGTRYNGRLSRIWFNLASGGYADTNGFEKGHTYTLTMNMATDDWRNGFGSVSVKCEGSNGQELSNRRVTFINYKKIKFSFTAPTDRWCQFVYIDLMSSDISSTYITGTNNWNLSSLVITDPAYDSSSGGSGSGGSSSSSTQDIINNANSNTNDIIDNANSNTDTLNQSINSNCKNSTLTLNNSLSNDSGYYLNNSGNRVSTSGTNITKYIELKPNTSYTLKKLTGGSTPEGMSLCLYNVNKAFSRCISYPSSDNFSQEFTPTSYEVYARFSIYSYRVFELTGYVCNNWDNENTQEIINNQNQNTQQQIESQQVCNETIIDKNSCKTNNKYLSSSGSETTNNDWCITDYLEVQNVVKLSTRGTVPSICYYNDNKQLISCSQNSDVAIGTLTLPNNTKFIRASINKSYNEPQYRLKLCKNGNQAINDVLTDDTDPNIADSEFSNLFNTVGFNDPLGYLLQLPVQFINQLVSQSNTCQTISLGTLWGVSLTLPCIDIGSIIGQQVWDIIDVLFSVGLLVVIFKNLYQTFANLMTMGGEKEAREKFSMPTPMEFLSIILGGDR